MNIKPDDLKSMSIDELWARHLEITSVLASRISAEKTQLEERLKQLQSSGVSNGKARHERRPYPQVFPKYRNPAEPSETWAGRGKQPRWLTAQLPNSTVVCSCAALSAAVSPLLRTPDTRIAAPGRRAEHGPATLCVSERGHASMIQLLTRYLR